MKKTFNRGFTLVEVLVAAGIVALSLISVVAFVRKGQEQVSLDKHRRMARSIVERAIEDPQFDLMNYPNLLPSDSVRTGLDIIDNNMTPPSQETCTSRYSRKIILRIQAFITSLFPLKKSLRPSRGLNTIIRPPKP